MRILLTNDDGVHAEGLQALLDALSQVGEVTVVGPDRERSAVGHSLTFHRPLRVEQVEDPRGTVYSTSGTPTDCVLLALYCLMTEKPHLVVSGINRGANLGDDITYSGTVAAAMEGMIHGVPSIAISQYGRSRHFDYRAASSFAVRLVRAVERHGMPPRTFLNVNVPDVPEEWIEGVEVTRQGHSIYNQRIERRTDPRGVDYYWVSGEVPTGHPDQGTDFWAVHNRRISVTPIQVNLTHFELLEELREWEF